MAVIYVEKYEYLKILKPWRWEPPGHNLSTPEPGRPGCVIFIQKGVKNCERHKRREEKTEFSALYIPPLGFKVIVVN